MSENLGQKYSQAIGAQSPDPRWYDVAVRKVGWCDWPELQVYDFVADMHKWLDRVAKPALAANIPLPVPNKPCPICMQHPSDPHKTWCRHWRYKAPDASGEAVAALVPQPKEAAARFDCKRAA
jgi:hypothetical protein